jgi:hypothetical protein
MATERRRRRQGGQEIVEFAVLVTLFVGMFLGWFVTGMSLIRSLQANQVCANLTNMYIHGADFSSYGMQKLAQKIAGGLDLEIGSSFSGNVQANTSNSGNVLATVTQIMWVGSTSDSNCVAAGGASKCTNHDSFVFTQRIQFGNGTIGTSHPSSLGAPTTTAITNTGYIQNPVTDSGAMLPTAAQSSMQSLWQVSGNGRTPLVDGQVCYVVEVYAQSPDLSLGSYQSSGVYARYFF